jgi:hypothetical protein
VVAETGEKDNCLCEEETGNDNQYRFELGERKKKKLLKNHRIKGEKNKNNQFQS